MTKDDLHPRDLHSAGSGEAGPGRYLEPQRAPQPGLAHGDSGPAAGQDLLAGLDALGPFPWIVAGLGGILGAAAVLGAVVTVLSILTATPPTAYLPWSALAGACGLAGIRLWRAPALWIARRRTLLSQIARARPELPTGKQSRAGDPE